MITLNISLYYSKLDKRILPLISFLLLEIVPNNDEYIRQPTLQLLYLIVSKSNDKNIIVIYYSNLENHKQYSAIPITYKYELTSHFKHNQFI